MAKCCTKVCVTGGSGYIGSWLVKKLLEKGYTVHVTLRSLADKSKVGLLKSLPNADTKLVLFQADIYSPNEFEEAIEGCEFVFHVATPMQHDPKSIQFKDRVEATIAGVGAIADICVKSRTVKRLIYTSSVVATSPLNEDGSGYKSCTDESCWTPPDLSLTYANDYVLEYTSAKTLAEKEVLRYNEIEDAKLEVVTLACGVVGGETILSHLPLSVQVIFSQISGNMFGYYQGLKFIEELLGSVPLVHIDDVCEAHIFCMEKPSMKGRFLCSAADPTVKEIKTHLEENHPEFMIDEKFREEPETRGIKCDSSKLIKMGSAYKYDMRKIIDDSLECGKRMGALQLVNQIQNSTT
ncbi:PREDICTED: vestitone reductase-like isoform X1 [Populus euphratica]|uniref:Vestitone reductase-like isoform X1 n=2 Tax=Populus euphratica TaxID=75702 RepID=A0AAJ6UCX7_POPEU|nr:PREDICTED: vestitone reductase-like isoform X1 [Populus euphratica]